MANYYSAPPLAAGRIMGPRQAAPSPYFHDHPGARAGFAPPPAGGGGIGGYAAAPAPCYGAAVATKFGPAPVFVRGQRRRLNIVAIAMSLFVPWLLFSAVFAIMSFSMHYQSPAAAYALVGVAFLVVVVSGVFAGDALRQKAAGVPDREPSWYLFICITSLLAWIAAVSLGDMNFFNNLQPFYDVLNLNYYPAVDPSRLRGQQLMDAGRIVFTDGAKLDLSKSMGFKNSEIYCVAPVTVGTKNVSHMTLATYDFWAVGTNCCSGNAADFHCGEFNNPRAHAGLRLMRDEQRAYFRLAVQQAEAAYNVKAVHPLFLYWMQDPMAEVSSYQDSGFRYYLIGMFTHFAIQLFLVVCAALAFSKMGSF